MSDEHGPRRRFNVMEGGRPEDDGLEFAPIPRLGEDPAPDDAEQMGPARVAHQDPHAMPPPPAIPAPAPAAIAATPAPPRDPVPTDVRHAQDLATALGRPYRREKLTIYVPPEAARRIFRLSVVAGEQLGKKKVPEYLIALAACMRLPDPDDPAAVAAMLDELAGALVRVADGEL